MQKALKDDEELVVWFVNATEKLRVMEIYLPSPKLAVLNVDTTLPLAETDRMSMVPPAWAVRTTRRSSPAARMTGPPPEFS